MNDPKSWSTPSFGAVGDGKSKKRAPAAVRKAKKGVAFSSPDVADNQLTDGQTAEAAIKVMNRVKDKSFFLAVGFVKPHLPFTAPKKYYDLYRAEDIKLSKNLFPPKDVSPIALTDFGELRGYKNIPDDGISPTNSRANSNTVITPPPVTPMRKSAACSTNCRNSACAKKPSSSSGATTAGNWVNTVFGASIRISKSPRACHSSSAHPTKKSAAQKRCARGVGRYLSVALRTSWPAARQRSRRKKSFVPLMENPKLDWRTAAFSQYPRGKLMGYSMRTDRYRYTEWAEKGKAPEGIELYDHKRDPDENVNIANLPENKKLVAQLSEQLGKGWKAAMLLKN